MITQEEADKLRRLIRAKTAAYLVHREARDDMDNIDEELRVFIEELKGEKP